MRNQINCIRIKRSTFLSMETKGNEFKEVTIRVLFNPLKRKVSLLYLKTQFVPRSKHF